jgi:micrococcal nuclease
VRKLVLCLLLSMVCRAALALAAPPAGVSASTPVPDFDVAQVVRVHDGDSVWIRPWPERTQGGSASAGGGRWVIRMHGIDAPEICQAFGKQSQQALAEHVSGQRLGVTWVGQDTYGRWLARLRLLDAPTSGPEADVGRWMVSKGYAWSYRFKGDAGPYQAEQTTARRLRLGLFADAAPTNPQRFRRSHGPCR